MPGISFKDIPQALLDEVGADLQLARVVAAAMANDRAAPPAGRFESRQEEDDGRGSQLRDAERRAA